MVSLGKVKDRYEKPEALGVYPTEFKKIPYTNIRIYGVKADQCDVCDVCDVCDPGPGK